MRNESVAVNQAADTEPLTRRRFMGVAAMLALCALKTACSLPIRVVGAGFEKPKLLNMHCGHAVAAEPPGSELTLFTPG